jgi:hypothetical protein
MAARGVEPGHTDAGSCLRPRDAFADLLDHARDLVAGYERELGEREGALQDSQVAVADAAGVDPDQDLTWTGGGPLALLDGYLAVLLLYDYGFHRVASSAARRTGTSYPVPRAQIRDHRWSVSAGGI